MMSLFTQIDQSRAAHPLPSVPQRRSLRTFVACLLGAVLVSALAGCQSARTEPASTGGQGGGMTAPGDESSGHGQSGSQDYQAVLSDPGPF